MSSDLNVNFDSSLALVEVSPDAYREEGGDASMVSNAIERLTSNLVWASEGNGPFGELIKPGSRVLIKPNFVLHYNQGTDGMEPMITHQSVIKAVVNAVLQAE